MSIYSSERYQLQEGRWHRRRVMDSAFWFLLMTPVIITVAILVIAFGKWLKQKWKMHKIKRDTQEGEHGISK
jgi:hypothetical protein